MPASRGGRASAGAVYLLLPLLVFVYAGIWLARNTPGSGGNLGEETELEDLDFRDALSGLEGEVELSGGARLCARLTPLHAAEAWQRFDAAALVERLELGPGEPWRLQLWLEDATGRSVAVDDARVDDGLGAALARVEAPANGDGGPHDPLGTLLAGAVEPLAADGQVLLVLWGRRPGDEARLVLAGEGREIPLRAVDVPRGGVPRHLARIDRRETGR